MFPGIEDSVRTKLDQGQLTEAVELILLTYGPELRGYLRGTFNDPDEGDDVYQELAIAIWRRLPDFEFRGALRNWCYAIAHRRVAKRLTRYSRRHRVRFDSEEQAQLVARSMSSFVEQQKRADALSVAAAQLDPPEREVLILRVERKLSFGEIAKVLELTNEASARKRYQRAKEHLKELLSQTGTLLKS